MPVPRSGRRGQGSGKKIYVLGEGFLLSCFDECQLNQWLIQKASDSFFHSSHTRQLTKEEELSYGKWQSCFKLLGIGNFTSLNRKAKPATSGRQDGCSTLLKGSGSEVAELLQRTLGDVSVFDLASVLVNATQAAGDGPRASVKHGADFVCALKDGVRNRHGGACRITDFPSAHCRAALPFANVADYAASVCIADCGVARAPGTVTMVK